MSGEPPCSPPTADALPADGDARPPDRPRLVLSTRTAVEASQGTLIDRVFDLQRPPAAAAGRPRRPTSPVAVASTPLPTAPSRTAARDHVCLAAQAYARALVREGVAPIEAVETVRATVHQEGVAFLSARRLEALERAVVRAARAVC